MFDKKILALFAGGLLLLTLCISGGCGGSSSGPTQMSVVGEIGDTDRETMEASGLELLSGDKEQIFASRNVLIADWKEQTDTKKSEVKEMFDIDGAAAISLYEPTSADITALKALLEVEDSAIIEEESLVSESDDSDIVTFTVSKGSNSMQSCAEINYGQDSKHQLVRDDSILKEDVDAGRVWVKYNVNNEQNPYDVIQYVLGGKIEDSDDAYYITEEHVIGTVDDDAVTIDNDAKTITVALNGKNYDCLAFQKLDRAYTVARPGKELPDDAEREIDETEVGTGIFGKGEGESEARKNNIEHFAGNLRGVQSYSSAYANAGRTNSETFFEKAFVWVKDTFTGTACADSKGPDELFDVAWKAIGKVGSTFDNLPGLNISVTTTIASTHHFDEDSTGKTGGNDYYYVKQSCVMNNGMAHNHWYQHAKYKPIKLKKAFGENDWFWIGGAECDEFYLSRYWVRAELVSNLRYPTVNCIKANPQAYNRETTKTTSHGWNVGVSGHGGTAHDALDAGLAFSFGYESKKSESYSTYDIECTLNNGHNIVSWEYPVTRLPQRDRRWTRLTYPADLAISTYQPAQCYIWQIPTSERNNYANVRNTISTRVSGAYSRNSGSLRERHVDYTVGATGEMRLPKPPLFCLDKQTINFDEQTAKTAYVTVYSQGTWEYDKATVPDWLELTRTDENYQLTIVAQPNTTGKTRTASINLKREDGSEKWDNRTITVTQSPYSK